MSASFSYRHWPLITAFLYGFISTSITFFNKAVLTLYQFHHPNIMTLAQIILSLMFLSGLKRYGVIKFADFDWERAKKVSPLAISFVGMVLTGLSALNYLNVPMFSALRRGTTLITMFCEWYFLRMIPSLKIQLSVHGMVAGAIVAAISDLDFNFYGYTMVLINSLFTAAYLICIAKFGKQGLDTFGLMYYNNLLSLPLVFVACVVNGDIKGFLNYPHLSSMGFWATFFISSVQAFLLNYSIFLCTKTNSALTTSVVGQIKNIATTAVGYFMFGDVSYDFFNVIGLGIGVVTSVLYSWFQFVEEAKKTDKPGSDTPQTSESPTTFSQPTDHSIQIQNIPPASNSTATPVHRPHVSVNNNNTEVRVIS
eukprot:TRINITY_DN4436_c0_g1_i2.p1 TRINITY_DN4436_c0_g1~~TRINITY_DN4436_c0_g1_i2.p1  ORF type:complete len:398 (-),score=109.70 TRINITY_DN4436_c0_g1_i2:112-1212(-)